MLRRCFVAQSRCLVACSFFGSQHQHAFHRQSSISIIAAISPTYARTYPQQPLGLLAPTIPTCIIPGRAFNTNNATQVKWEADRQAQNPRTDYDFDKESWMKNMRFASMECVMDPDIHPIKWTSFSGIRKGVSRWLTLRKLVERRPGYKFDDLKELYIKYKKTANADYTAEIGKQLTRLTTYGEAQRLEKDCQERSNKKFAKGSWKAFSVATSSSSSSSSGAAAGPPKGYDIELVQFELVNCFLGQMTNEDWLQVTVKVRAKHRFAPTEEFVEFIEYPVFEVKLGDGIKTSNNSPFTVVAVMDKDGSRYGRDGQDAAVLRKNLARQKKSWFGGLFG